MFEFFEDLYLVAHDFDIFFFLALLLDRLYSHELTGEFASCLVDVPVGALADQGQNVVVFFFVFAHRRIQMCYNVKVVFEVKMKNIICC